jgi:lipoate---protein ligase
LTAPWRVDTLAGPAGRLLQPPGGHERSIRFLLPDDQAVVLGSTQPESHVDAAAAARAGMAVLRRRGGGGAVVVGPGQVLWADVMLPAGDPLWSADVGRAFWWLGDLWVSALAAAGVNGAAVWRGGLVRSPWSDRVCFAGLGPGEVTVGGVKVVGLSQRRTRAGAHFQCAVPIVWQPEALLSVMALPAEVRGEAAEQLAGRAMGIGSEAAERLITALVERLS